MTNTTLTPAMLEVLQEAGVLQVFHSTARQQMTPYRGLLVRVQVAVKWNQTTLRAENVGDFGTSLAFMYGSHSTKVSGNRHLIWVDLYNAYGTIRAFHGQMR